MYNKNFNNNNREERQERGDQVPPVQEGQELTVKILSLGTKGDGVAKVQRFAIIVPGTQPDEEVNIRITRVLPNLAFAEVIQ